MKFYVENLRLIVDVEPRDNKRAASNSDFLNKFGGSTGARTPDLVHVKDAL